MSETPQTVHFDEFLKLDLRVATVLAAEAHPNADRLIVLQVDLGTEQRQIVAGLRGHYEPAALVGQQVVIVTNLSPRVMRGQKSEGMLLAACSPDQSSVIVLKPERAAQPGWRVS